MRLLQQIRLWRERLALGVDPGDRRPGEEHAHLRGAARRRAMRRGLIGPDGATRTNRLHGPGDEDRTGSGAA